jgi:hypothetical protein
MRVEADEAKFLDDVIVMRQDGRLVVRQVKFSTNPEGEGDAFTWEKLLAEPPGKPARKRMSLLKKWAFSLSELRATYQIAEASVISNRTAGADLQAVINRTTGLVDFDNISAAVRVEIISQLGGEPEAHQFFAQFRFNLNEPSLDDLEGLLRRRFDRLSGTEIGWLSLKNEVRFWVSHRNEPSPHGEIKLSDVIRAARWNALQSLPQRFNVPPDYVIPSEGFHKDVQSTLLSSANGCYVITGSPGVGKSTYTSYLYDQLKDQGTAVIRHHYYLSQDDQAGVIRLEHIRAAESLMCDLKHNYTEALGSNAGDNPVAVKLRDWLVACGGFYPKESARLVVIIDGLDHVWRDTRSIDELNRLLTFILPVPDGIVVLLATQPVDDSQLPPLLLRYAPRDSWLKLPLMDKPAVLTWLHHHESEVFGRRAELEPPQSDHVRQYQFTRIGEALYEKSGGHPLHLRYTLRALQERDQLVTVENIERLPGCAHDDIRDYYRELWGALPEESKGILHLLTANRFPWTKRAILECLNPEGTGYSSLSLSLRQVEHLLSDTGMGLRAFHSSLLAFIEGLPEHADHRSAMQRNALNWLRRDAPEYLRWAYEWVIEADLGNDTALRDGPNREWLVQAIAKRYSSEQILDLLCRSIWCSLQREDLPRAVEVGLLHDYCVRAFESDPEILEQLLRAQLMASEVDDLSLRIGQDLSRLTESDIALLAIHEARKGNITFVKGSLDELAKQINRPDEQTHVEWSSQALAIITVAALLEDVEPAKIVDFVLSNRETADVHEMLNSLAFALRAERNSTRLKRVLSLQPSTSENFNVRMRVDEREYIVRHAVWLALEEGFELDDEARRAENGDDPYYLMYAAIRKIENFQARPARLPNVLLFESKYIGPGSPSRQRKDLFYSSLAGFVANRLWGFQNADWIGTIGRASKIGRCLIWLDLMAGKIAELLTTGKSPAFGLLYEGLKDFDDPAKGEPFDIEASGLRNDVARAVRHFALDLLSVTVAIEGTAEIDKSDLEIAFASGYCHWDTWMNQYVAHRRRWLGENALSWLLESQTTRLAITVEPFPERATTYSILASVAASHGREDEARQLIGNTAANMVTHGNHKDLLFFHSLHAIKQCHRAGITEARDWLVQLATPIAHVEEFTDGDETGHLPRELAEMLLEISPDLFPAYYAWLCEEEEAYDALHAFNSFLRVADFSSPVNRAIAATAIDSGSLKILNERATEDQYARAILDSARDLLGEKGLEKSLREEPRAKSDSLERHPSPVAPRDYPPDSFEGYLAALEANERVWREEAIEEWINYWLAEKLDEAVFTAIEHAVARGIELRNYDRIFELALRLYGRDRAYSWLVKAHKEQRGWNRYWSGEDEARRRWQHVARLYPDRWFDFIKQTLGNENEKSPWQGLYLDSSRTARIIEYCLRLNKTDLARGATKSFVQGSLQLVHDLPLTAPFWINGSDQPTI